MCVSPKSRGERLHEALDGQVADDPAAKELLEEACRICDRLDKLDALLTGDADVWCRLVHNLRTEDYELRIDGALMEARQQANTLRQIVATIASLAPKEPDDADDDGWAAGLSTPVRDPAN